jgi:NtrC-family two-component system response regulator AlgB
LRVVGANGATPSADASNGGAMSLEKLEEQHIRRVLAQTRTVAEAAAILGIDEATVYRKRKKFGLV